MERAKNGNHERSRIAGQRCILPLVLATWQGLFGEGVVHAANIPVTVCGDVPQPGGYTLRQAVSYSSDGDTVDLKHLSCVDSTITLTEGAIFVYSNDLKIESSKKNPVEVTTSGKGSIFWHLGTGTLSLAYLNIENGGGNYGGGCILSQGSVVLGHSSVSGCTTIGSGGGIAAYGSVSLYSSTVSGNTAMAALGGGGGVLSGNLVAVSSTISNNSAPSFSSVGGGVFSTGHVVLVRTSVSGNSSTNFGGGIFSIHYQNLTDSTISGNSSYHGGGSYCVGFLSEKSTIRSSTISGNSAVLGGGIGFDVYAMTIVNGTISGNSALDRGGGVYVGDSNLSLYNTTIAFNTAGDGAGIYAQGNQRKFPFVIHAESTIISKNRNTDPTKTFADISASTGYTSISLGGSGNLVGTTNLTGLQLTVQGDPLLAPLAYHGGPVQTHALLLGSPAIDAGNNVLHLLYDARGKGFLRVAGPSADIGAYERQIDDDELFYGGFD
jgi:hypothetical protein